ncbi:hypothetical protein MPSEU_000030700 [Mayamaea pseudoterrestris]|nr:hypothetical protein MPSEU_000030700 [Mayamaea pseudoterrestris]
MSFLTSSSSSYDGRAAVKSDSDTEDDECPTTPFPFPSFMTMPPTRTFFSNSSSSSDDEETAPDAVSYVSSNWNPLDVGDEDLECKSEKVKEPTFRKKEHLPEQAPASFSRASTAESVVLPIILCVFFCCTVPVIIPILIVWYAQVSRDE